MSDLVLYCFADSNVGGHETWHLCRTMECAELEEPLKNDSGQLLVLHRHLNNPTMFPRVVPKLPPGHFLGITR